MPYRLLNRGARHGPLITAEKLPSHRPYKDLALRSHLRLRPDWSEDFDGAPDTYEITVPLYSVTSNAATILVGANSRGFVIAPRTGVLVGAYFIGEDDLAGHDSNYITLTVTNVGPATGTTAMLASSDLNTTKATGGYGDYTGKSKMQLTLSGTAASLRTVAGDGILVTATVAGTLANAVDFPQVRLVFQAVQSRNGIVPISSQPSSTANTTAGVSLVANTANGEAACQLPSVNGTIYCGLSFGDQVQFIGGREFVWQARFKLSGMTTNQRAVIGLGSGFNATFDSIVSNAWLRLEGSLAALIEGDDGTTDTDDKPGNVTLAANTYYWLTINAINLRKVGFWLDETYLGTVALTAWSDSTLLQPLAVIHKGSGTGTPTLTVDTMRLWGTRYPVT
jgi:hypothetical protein